MEIVYPPLVEQAFKYYTEELHEKIDKSELYRAMVADNIITQTGLPTEYALQAGYVKDFYEPEDLTFEEFLEIYPVFKLIDCDEFALVDGYWEIPITLKKELQGWLQTKELSFEHRQQIIEYLSER